MGSGIHTPSITAAYRPGIRLFCCLKLFGYLLLFLVLRLFFRSTVVRVLKAKTDIHGVAYGTGTFTGTAGMLEHNFFLSFCPEISPGTLKEAVHGIGGLLQLH